jgi:hypothetical protein
MTMMIHRTQASQAARLVGVGARVGERAMLATLGCRCMPSARGVDVAQRRPVPTISPSLRTSPLTTGLAQRCVGLQRRGTILHRQAVSLRLRPKNRGVAPDDRSRGQRYHGCSRHLQAFGEFTRTPIPYVSVACRPCAPAFPAVTNRTPPWTPLVVTTTSLSLRLMPYASFRDTAQLLEEREVADHRGG